jgi:hypothetical protein
MLPSTILNTLLVTTFYTFSAHWTIDAKQVCSDLTKGSQAVKIYNHAVRDTFHRLLSFVAILHENNKRHFNSMYGKHANNETNTNPAVLSQYEMYVSNFASDFAMVHYTQDYLPVLLSELEEQVADLCPSGRPRRVWALELMDAFSKIKQTYQHFIDTKTESDAALRRLAVLSCSCGWREMELEQCVENPTLNPELEYCVDLVFRTDVSIGLGFVDTYRSLRLWWLSY